MKTKSSVCHGRSIFYKSMVSIEFKYNFLERWRGRTRREGNTWREQSEEQFNGTSMKTYHSQLVRWRGITDRMESWRSKVLVWRRREFNEHNFITGDDSRSTRVAHRDKYYCTSANLLIWTNTMQSIGKNYNNNDNNNKTTTTKTTTTTTIHTDIWWEKDVFKVSQINRHNVMFTNRITFTIEKALTLCFIQQQLTVTIIRNATFRHHRKL